jgi:hypothetical protein
VFLTHDRTQIVDRAPRPTYPESPARSVRAALLEALRGLGGSRVRAIAPIWLESSNRVLQSLLESVRTFAHGAPQNDDVTALIVCYTPTGL